MKKLALFLKSLFDFRKPIVYALECVDLVIEDHALLLLSWHFKKHYSIKVRETNTAYRSNTGSAIVKLPQEENQVTIVVSNYWRKVVKIFELRKIQLDEITVQLLISELHLMPLPDIDPFNVRLKNINSKIILPHCQLQTKHIAVHNINIQIIPTFLNYTAT